MEEKFNLFMGTGDEHFRDFAGQIYDCLIEQDCNYKIKTAKSGYVVSDALGKAERTLAIFVFPRTGMKRRICWFPKRKQALSSLCQSRNDPTDRETA